VSPYGCDMCQFEIFLFIKMYCHVADHDCATCQANNGCFWFSPSLYYFD